MDHRVFIYRVKFVCLFCYLTLTDNGNYSPNATPCPRHKQHHCQNLKSDKKSKKEMVWWENTNKDHEETGLRIKMDGPHGLVEGCELLMMVLKPCVLQEKFIGYQLIKQWHYFLFEYSNCTFDANRWSTSCNSCQRILNLDQLP